MLKNISKVKNKKILCYLDNISNFELFFPICSLNSDIDFFIISNVITIDDFRRAKLFTLDNVYYLSEIQRLKFQISYFGAFITTNAYSVASNEFALNIIKLAKDESIPVIKLQTELFEPLVHFDTTFKKDIYSDESFITNTLEDHYLAFFLNDYSKDTTVIGYPCYYQDVESIDEGYGLILSNMDWYPYSRDDIQVFYKTVLEFIQNSEVQTFIWKMNDKELSNSVCMNFLSNLFNFYPNAKEKIVFCHENEMLKRVNDFELIRKSSFVINSLGIKVLDCKLANKNTFVFNCKNINVLTNKLNGVAIFNNILELEDLITQQNQEKFDYLVKFDNSKFRDLLDRCYLESK